MSISSASHKSGKRVKLAFIIIGLIVASFVIVAGCQEKPTIKVGVGETVITPPVGINVYVVSVVVPDVPLEVIFKGIFPFLGALIVAVALLMAFPQIATFLPSLATY